MNFVYWFILLAEITQGAWQLAKWKSQEMRSATPQRTSKDADTDADTDAERCRDGLAFSDYKVCVTSLRLFGGTLA